MSENSFFSCRVVNVCNRTYAERINFSSVTSFRLSLLKYSLGATLRRPAGYTLGFNAFLVYLFSRSAKLTTGLYILLALISSFFLFYFFTMSKAISVSTGPIFTIFSSSGRYLRKFFRSSPVFPIPQGTLPWQPIFVVSKTQTTCDFYNFYTI